jgi:hypothetical protein
VASVICTVKKGKVQNAKAATTDNVSLNVFIFDFESMLSDLFEIFCLILVSRSIDTQLLVTVMASDVTLGKASIGIVSF